MQALKGKSVLVTGASSGIGRASAKAFAKEGMRVAVSARSTDRLRELLKELGGGCDHGASGSDKRGRRRTS